MAAGLKACCPTALMGQGRYTFTCIYHSMTRTEDENQFKGTGEVKMTGEVKGVDEVNLTGEIRGQVKSRIQMRLWGQARYL